MTFVGPCFGPRREEDGWTRPAGSWSWAWPAESTPRTPRPAPCGPPCSTSPPTRRSPAVRPGSGRTRAEGGTTRAADLVERLQP
ncbi:hypothetical protein ACFQQB_65730 [Nonomuraea rubra]|uniref:hypothetical protein n=1 Tax=Nonomuraea rubra TaxID=46180 RepID=UPI003620AD16